MSKEEFIRHLGKNIRKIRESKNYTQAEIANFIGKDRQSYQRIELGITNPTVGYLYDIARVLDTPLSSFFMNIKNND